MSENKGGEASAYELTLLDPACVQLFKTGGDAVRATISDPKIGPERTYLQVQIARAYPLSEPERYIGLRDGKDRDIGLLVTLDTLDDHSRAVLDAELARRYFLPRVTQVHKVKKEYETVTWDVETDRGRRVYSVQNLKESVQEITPGRLVVTDRSGSRFEFPDIARLGGETLQLLSRVL
jgi:hypothetical protein